MIPMFLSYIDENIITMSWEAVLMERKITVNGSGIAENIAVYVAAELMKNLRESWHGIDKGTRVPLVESGLMKITLKVEAGLMKNTV